MTTADFHYNLDMERLVPIPATDSCIHNQPLSSQCGTCEHEMYLGGFRTSSMVLNTHPNARLR